MAALRDEGVHVEGEASLQDPEALEAEGGGKAGVGEKEPWVAGEDEAKEGGEGGDPG